MVKVNPTAKKVINIVVNVLVVLILLLALLVTINNVVSSQQGYTSLFGNAFMVVQSESMDAERPEQYSNKPKGFKKGDLLRVRILNDQQKTELEEGDIISFFIPVDGNSEMRVVNSHRIISVETNPEGKIVYKTKGDNNAIEDGYIVTSYDAGGGLYSVIGVVEDNLGGIGNMFAFFQSSTGFLVCIVIPSFLVVVYFIFNLAREIYKVKKAGAEEQESKNKEKYKEELMAELRAQGKLTDDSSADDPDDYDDDLDDFEDDSDDSDDSDGKSGE